MVRDVSSYYLLGYTSTRRGRATASSTRFKVQVKRRDVEVRARKGYWAFTPEEVERASAAPKAGPPREVAEALEELATVVEPAGRQPVTVWMGAVRGPAERRASRSSGKCRQARRPTPLDAVDHITITRDVDLRRQAVQRPGGARSAGRHARAGK